MHFHLKTGGVTTVIRQQVEALQGICEPLVLSGFPPKTDFPCPVISIPGIGYDTGKRDRTTPEKIADKILQAIHAHWKNGCDLLHVHNPTLAKNRNYIKILKLLKHKGIRLFLQIHDFAEDGRPQAYFKDHYVPDCHYGVINSRDYAILLKSGLKPEGLHFTGNMVTALPACNEPITKTGHVLYPVRAIRRKNIGEAILLACFFPENTPLLVTLPPNSPVDFPAYEGWKRFVAQNRLNVAFEVGLTNNFSALVHSAAWLLTTSISEGFGFSFMEPWTAGKFLWGRDLPGITDDFKKNGLSLGHLYDRIRVPLDWLLPEGFQHTWEKAVARNLDGFGIDPGQFDIQQEFKRLARDGTIDFGLLNERLQQTVVLKIIFDDGDKNRFKQLNPFLADCGRGSCSESLISHNRELIETGYSRKVYRRNLSDIYQAVMTREPIHAIDKKVLMQSFLNFNTFSLLKWGEHAA